MFSRQLREAASFRSVEISKRAQPFSYRHRAGTEVPALRATCARVRPRDSRLLLSREERSSEELILVIIYDNMDAVKSRSLLDAIAIECYRAFVQAGNGRCV
jgi:hypothetical protein